MGKWKTREDREMKRLRKVSGNSEGSRAWTVKKGQRVSFEEFCDRLIPLAERGEPEAIVMLSVIHACFEQGFFECPLCEERSAIVGSAGLGYYPLDNGKTRMYGYLLCPECANKMASVSPDAGKSYATRIENYFESMGSFKVDAQ